MHYLPTPLIGKDHISHNNSAHGQEAQAKIKELSFNYIRLENEKLIFHTTIQLMDRKPKRGSKYFYSIGMSPC